MEKYLSAVREMYSQFKKVEAHPMEKYIGRLAYFRGEKLRVIGYSSPKWGIKPCLIVDASQNGGWSALAPFDVIFKECEGYSYVSVNDLID